MARRQADYQVATVELAGWDEALAAFPEHTVFHRRAWLELLTEHHGLRSFLVRVDDGPSCVALWPCLELHKGPFRVLGSPLSGLTTPYMGPLLASDHEPGPLLAAVFESGVFERPAWFEVRVGDEGRAIDLEPHGFTRLLEFETFILDTRSGEEALWEGLKRQCRQHVQKAQRFGVEVRAEADASFVDEFMAMSDEVFAKWGKRPQYDAAFLRRAYESLAPAGHLHVLSAFVAGERVASYVLLRDDHTLYAWLAASWAHARPVAPGNLVQWEAIRLAQQLRLRYDFVSASGTAGDFKSGFGGERRRVATHWGRSGSRLTAVLKDVYEEIVRFWRGA